MATYNLDQIREIVVKNPNKGLLEKARAHRKKYMRLVHGVGIKESLDRDEFFENNDIYNSRKKDAISLKDVFQRVLNEEDQVFTARGGSVNYGLSQTDERKMNILTDNVRFNISLHNWVHKFALQAFRTDPGGIIHMESEPDGSNCYPTYKSSDCIHDYLPYGRELEYVCFKIFRHELATYGIKDDSYSAGDIPHPDKNYHDGGTAYFRFVDDEKDIIVKRDGDNVFIAQLEGNINPLPNAWGKVPAFIVSDLISFNDVSCFDSPLSYVSEIAECFLYDRSIYNLQKKYHGFAKAIEPLLKCSNCAGTGTKGGNTCPECTLPGQTQGTGYKLRTKIADVSKFPMEILKDVPSFSFEKIYGYVAPPLETLKEQKLSLAETENLIYYTYWNINNTQVQGFNGTQGQEETATKTITNLQPKYARLNVTADWGENTEKMIADFIGQFHFKSWKGANIRYGRNYVLETIQDIANQYFEICQKGAPDALKDEALQRYIMALYQNNPMQQAKHLKLMRVIPFPHNTAEQIEASSYIPLEDKLMKRYGGEWVDTLQVIEIIDSPEVTLREKLKEYVADRMGLIQGELDKQKEEKEAA